MFRSPAAGALLALVADHVVQSRVVFPGAAHLEMARAAASATVLSSASGVALRSVFFLQPLFVETPGLQVDCMVDGARLEVQSVAAEDSTARVDAVVHLSGSFSISAAGELRRVDHASTRGRLCTCAGSVRTLYDGYDFVGLQYGPGFRMLEEAWAGRRRSAAARLRGRSSQQGTRVHPADLDDALCMSAFVASSRDGETRLPFAVDRAMLQGGQRKLWAVVDRPPASEAVSVGLGALGRTAQAQLDGFKSRVLRAEAPTQRHVYAAEWRSL
jgi:hypothetical protein